MRRLATLLVVLLAAACDGRVELGVAPSPSGGSPTTSAPAPGYPQELVGWWRVTTPEDGGDLGLGEDGYVVHPCGASDISWGASPSGLFVAAVFGGDGSCYEQPPRPDVSWLEAARSYQVEGAEVSLRDSDGAVVVRATREAAPTGRGEMRLTPRLRAGLQAPAALPAGVAPATTDALFGRWVPRGEDATNDRAYASFAVDGTRLAFDGCNGTGGRWILGAGGEFLTTQGITPLVGCSNAPVPGWVGNARRLGLQDGALLLYDGKGRLLGRLWRTAAG